MPHSRQIAEIIKEMNEIVIVITLAALVLVTINEFSAIIVGEEKVTVKTLIIVSLIIAAICVTHSIGCGLCL
jgi:hypothetical protein